MVTKAEVSHTAFLYWDESFQLEMVMEASDVGFRIIPLEKFKKDNIIIAIITPKIDIEKGFLQQTVNWLGDFYDYWGLIGFLWVSLGKKLKRRWGNPLSSKKEVVCAESVIRVLKAASYPGVEALDSEATNPQELYEFLKRP